MIMPFRRLEDDKVVLSRKRGARLRRTSNQKITLFALQQYCVGVESAVKMKKRIYSIICRGGIEIMLPG
jgi:hypothetical protein